ncbi:L-fucose:H+ symporter permease [Spirosoma utsteinense]|uniref:FHS family L-fucose permease-like MFS transporter n=1 Tax=Spirosoma utsteinense TaxID=2585773 RepID=A0ABR6W2H7_9BACT|nr:L-fucose:H+ symporter permease [Spirosoma utsteinense]MBC3785075.1 FHS family L-fucose permease-like MFS transporter [Spirosoma utsteinense]MBC3790316.1 FHS family L-fucose permease-like MFS transporter [Spirosoma utsteinense]
MPATATARPNASASFTEPKFLITLVFVTSLFMFWGIAITMGDVLNKHFQHVLSLTKTQSAFVQFAIFGAYFVMGIPAGLFMKRFGYKNGVLLGLSLFAIGSFLFVPAAAAASFTYFGIALFILGCGISTLETVAHPFVASLGDQRTSDQRINFAQAFNALGAIIGPAIGSYFLLRNNTAGSTDLTSVKTLYIVIGSVIATIAILFSFVKVPALVDPHSVVDTDAANVDAEPGKTLFQHKHFVWAVIAQFFNVAAQGGTWAFFINYGHEKMGFSDATAGNYMVLFMGLMLAGRFVGTFLMRVIAPNNLLAIFAACNIVMCIIIAQSFGWPSFIALMMLNFFFSIMFPTIFSLGLKNLGAHTQQASSFISMGVVGGAVFPFLMGMVAEKDVASAYYLPIICYAVIFLFGARFSKAR